MSVNDSAVDNLAALQDQFKDAVSRAARAEARGNVHAAEHYNTKAKQLMKRIVESPWPRSF